MHVASAFCNHWFDSILRFYSQTEEVLSAPLTSFAALLVPGKMLEVDITHISRPNSLFD
jgi:hypothetical protein